jgi:hypothetical protein
MKNTKTYYQLILDRSGSMSSCIEETIDGVNQQIRRIREINLLYPEQMLVTSLTLFNHVITPAWKLIRHEDLSEVKYSDYHPEGFTALLDAIGISVTNLVSMVGSEVETGEASVVVVIVTDGYENASVNFTHSQVAKMIKSLEETGRWTFSYIGATLDAVTVANGLNIKTHNAMRFHISKSAEVFGKVSHSINSYIASKQAGTVPTDFLDPEEDRVSLHF